MVHGIGYVNYADRQHGKNMHYVCLRFTTHAGIVDVMVD